MRTHSLVRSPRRNPVEFVAGRILSMFGVCAAFDTCAPCGLFGVRSHSRFYVYAVRRKLTATPTEKRTKPKINRVHFDLTAENVDSFLSRTSHASEPDDGRCFVHVPLPPRRHRVAAGVRWHGINNASLLRPSALRASAIHGKAVVRRIACCYPAIVCRARGAHVVRCGVPCVHCACGG